MSDNKMNNEAVVTLNPVQSDNKQVRNVEIDDQEALWNRSLKFFEAMNEPTQKMAK